MPEPVASEVASAAAAVASGHVSGRLGSRWSRAGPAACVGWAYKCSMTTHGTNGFEGQICSLCLFSNEIACFRHYVGQDLTWAIRTVSPWSGTRESLDLSALHEHTQPKLPSCSWTWWCLLHGARVHVMSDIMFTVSGSILGSFEICYALFTRPAAAPMTPAAAHERH